MKHAMPSPKRRQRGLTLVELLVAITIGLVVVLAATNVLILGESQKRTTNSNNDTSQSGAFAAYTLDRVLRSAGSGFAQSWNQGVFGCRLSVARSGTVILPRSTAFPAPFAGFLGSAPGTLALAPVLIGASQSEGGSDVLMVMSGNGSAGDAARQIRSGVAATNNLRMDNTVGLRSGDLGLVTQPGSTDCLLEQVNVTDATAFAAVGNEVLPLGSTYLNTDAKLGTMAASGNAFFSTVGNALANNVQFQLFGVDANRTLVAYDLLRSGATGTTPDPVQPLADGVAELHAMYGISNAGPPYNNVFTQWVAPTGDWAIATVMADPAKMRRIVAVRIALVMRDATYEKEIVTTSRPVLFEDTPGEIGAVTYTTGDNQHYRLRVIDTSIPLRNMLLLPAS